MAEFGVTAAMTSIVLSVFMAGLGLGSWGAGILVRRLRKDVSASALRLYALAELLIGISALLVPHLLRWGHALLLKIHGKVAWQSSTYYMIAGVWVALALIPWGTCMGATFPLLMGVIRQSSETESERSFSYLYIANVLGALLGTTASAYFMIELLGFRGTLRLASAFNGVLAASAFLLSFTAFPSPPIRPLAAERKTHGTLYGLPESSILWMLFTTGLVTMGMEVVWIRQLTPYLGNVVYAFAGILAVYLISTCYASYDYRSWARFHQPRESAWAWEVSGLFALIPLAACDPLLPIRIGSFELAGVRLTGIVPFCCLAGFLTPMLIDAWSLGEQARCRESLRDQRVGLHPGAPCGWVLPATLVRRAVGSSSTLFAAVCTGRRHGFTGEDCHAATPCQPQGSVWACSGGGDAADNHDPRLRMEVSRTADQEGLHRDRACGRKRNGEAAVDQWNRHDGVESHHQVHGALADGVHAQTSAEWPGDLFWYGDNVPVDALLGDTHHNRGSDTQCPCTLRLFPPGCSAGPELALGADRG